MCPQNFNFSSYLPSKYTYFLSFVIQKIAKVGNSSFIFVDRMMLCEIQRKKSSLTFMVVISSICDFNAVRGIIFSSDYL